MGIWSLKKSKSENETNITTKEVVIAKADALYDQEQYQDIYKLLINFKVIILLYYNSIFL